MVKLNVFLILYRDISKTETATLKYGNINPFMISIVFYRFFVSFRRLVYFILFFLSKKLLISDANSIDPDQAPRSDLGLHFLLRLGTNVLMETKLLTYHVHLWYMCT